MINSIDSFTGQSVPAPITWFPPIPWQGYMMRGFPPSLLSPASKHASFPTFFIWRETGGGNGTDCGFVTWKLLKQGLSPRSDAQWETAAGRQNPREIQGRPSPCAHTHRAKLLRVEIGHEDLRIDVLQIPGKALTLEFVPEIYTLGDVSKRALWRETVASL